MYESWQLSDHYDGFAWCDSGSLLRCRFTPTAGCPKPAMRGRVPQAFSCGTCVFPSSHGGQSGGLRPDRPRTVFGPWLARHLRRKKRQWHCPPRASAGGWIIGSSDNGPPAGRFHYSSGEPGRPASSRELDWSIRPIRYIHLADAREIRRLAASFLMRGWVVARHVSRRRRSRLKRRGPVLIVR